MVGATKWMGALAALAVIGCSSPDDTGPSGLDLDAMDLGADPCLDFYQYACGGWIATHPVGDDGAIAARFFDPYYEAFPRLHQIMENDAAGIRSPDDPHADLIGGYYGSCLAAPDDLSSRDKLRARLAEIDAVTSLDDLARQVARQRKIGSGSFFSVYVGVDLKNATRYTLVLDQGGFELDDRSYYLDPDQKGVLARYLDHINALSALIGGTPIDAAAAIRVETALAEASLPSDERRDPEKLYHLLPGSEAAALAPMFPWKAFWEEAGFAEPAEIDVVVPAYFMALDALLQTTPLDDLKSYLRLQLLQDYSDSLDQAFLDEDFSFFRTFSGETSQPPRWFSCYNDTLGPFGDAIAVPYVARFFDERSAATTQGMVDRERASFAARMATATWLDEPTRKEALTKLESMVARVGHPATGPDLAGLTISASSYFDNAVNLQTFSYERRKARLGTPVDRTTWSLSPVTVNASYRATDNALTLPAALLTSPFLVSGRIDAANDGALGMVIGHEMTHGFDDVGRHFDGDGSLHPWWTPTVEQGFTERAQCLVEQFDAFESLPGEHVNGAFTLGENIADLGGLAIAHDALLRGEGGTKGGDGYDAEQVFFLSYAQTWCENVRPDLARQRLLTDPHAPGRYRVNGPLANLPSFREAFSCGDDSPMVHKASCSVW